MYFVSERSTVNFKSPLGTGKPVGSQEDMTYWIGLYWFCFYALCKNWECCIPQWCLIKCSQCPWGFLLSSGTLRCDFWFLVTNHKFVSFLEVFCVSHCSTCGKNVLWTFLAKKEHVHLWQRMAWPNAPSHIFFSCMWHRTFINREVILGTWKFFSSSCVSWNTRIFWKCCL